jgi:hypothetical protein
VRCSSVLLDGEEDASGGDDGAPLLQRTGYLATTPEQYADALLEVFTCLTPAQRLAMTAAARAHAAEEFSDERFSMGVYRSLMPLVRDGMDAARERRAGEAEARKRAVL